MLSEELDGPQLSLPQQKEMLLQKVKADNAEELFSQPDIDGGLIGGASLKSDDFSAICRAAGLVRS